MRGSTVEHQLENFMNGVVRRNPGEAEFHQAVEEVVVPAFQARSARRRARLGHEPIDGFLEARYLGPLLPANNVRTFADQIRKVTA